MSIRKLVCLSIIALLFYGSHFYLEMKYNPQVVEYSYIGNISDITIDKMKNKFINSIFNINLKTYYKNSNLIITSGKDLYVKDLPIIKGDFIVDSSTDCIVIGDKVANKYFSKLNVIENEIKLLNKSFKIKGIIKNCNNIYLPYNENLVNIGLYKQTIQFIPNSNSDFYFLLEDFEDFLKNEGITITNRVVYKAKINNYLNLSIGILIYTLAFYAIRFAKRLKINILLLWKDYISHKRVLEWYNYLNLKKFKITICILQLLSIGSVFFTVYLLLSRLFIPPYLIPSNIFSLSDYLIILRNIYISLMFHLENGFPSILIDTIMINIVIVFIILLGLIINIKNHYIKNPHQ